MSGQLGRRETLLNISLLSMIVSSIGFSLLSVVLLVCYVVAFELGVGLIPWLMMTEITPSSHPRRLRSLPMSSWYTQKRLSGISAVLFAKYTQAYNCYKGHSLNNSFLII